MRGIVLSVKSKMWTSELSSQRLKTAAQSTLADPYPRGRSRWGPHRNWAWAPFGLAHQTLLSLPQTAPLRLLPWTHQGATAEQNHEDDEGLKPVVLHDEEAGFPQDPPRLAQPLFDVDLAAFKPLDTTWHQRERRVRPWEQAPPRPALCSVSQAPPGAAPPHSREYCG